MSVASVRGRRAVGAHRLALLLSVLGVLALGCEEPAAPAEWTVLRDDLDGVLLSASGDSIDRVWAVGGPLGSAGEALVLRRDGDGWARVPTGFDATLWWVWARGDEAFMVGERGTMRRWNGSGLDVVESGTTATLFGVWGSSGADVWAVGGDPFAEDETDVVLRWDGAAVSRVPVPDPEGVALFKVWGRAADDVWIVGARGTILHWDGSALTRAPSPTTASLFTVHGNSAGDAWAVGGPPAVLLHLEDGAWVEVPPPGPAQVFQGVHVGERGDVMVVGWRGTKFYRSADGAWSDEFDAPPEGDLHGAWMADGHVLAVGGNFNSPVGSPRAGILAYRGAMAPAAP